MTYKATTINGEPCKYCQCSEFTPHGYCSECGNKRDSEEGEQPMKEEIDIIQLHEEWRKTDDLNFFDWLKQQGYTLTKK